MKRQTARAKLTERLRALRDALTTGLVERDEAVRLALLAALAGEHLLLIGPPGTAKSLLARRLGLAIRDATCFERLLTRFSVPEELFGPLSIKGLEEDRYERLTDGYLPTATVAFMDEVFKANSAILNSLLTLLNEREFDNGRQRVRTPLVCVVGASNELPKGEELDALYDRFLLRLKLDPVSEEAFEELLALRGDGVPAVDDALRLSPEDLELLRAESEQVAVPEDVIDLLSRLRMWLYEQDDPASDRRWRKVLQLLQVSAYTNGRDEVSIWDCWLLQHCTWGDPDNREEVYDWYAERVGATAALDLTRLTQIVVAWEAQLTADEGARSQARSTTGCLLYRSPKGKRTASTQSTVHARRDGEPLYLAPPGAERRNHHGNYREVEGRDNDGAGYTREELAKLYVEDRHGYRRSFDDWSDKDAYLGKQTNWLMEQADLSPWMEPTRHKAAYVADCLRQLEVLSADVERYAQRLDDHMGELSGIITTHLWVTPDFVEPATSVLEETRGTVAGLRDRLEQLCRGYEALPRDADGPAATAACDVEEDEEGAADEANGEE